MHKPVTIKTIAQEMGLSISAVSKALNDYKDINPETKKLVIKKAVEMGYSPNTMARNLVMKTSNFIGVVVRDITTVYGEMFKALNAVARKHNLTLILYDTNRDKNLEKACVQNLIGSMVRGIIVAPVSEDVSDICAICEGRLPIVFLGGRVVDQDKCFVASDSRLGAQSALEYLIEQGHRNIALICDSIDSASRNSKIRIYKKKMKEIGAPERIFYGQGDSTDITAAGYEQTKLMLKTQPDVTAVFVVKDIMAVGVMQAIQEAGLRIPEDISVIGYDGIDAAALPMIDLTTISQPREEMAEQVIDILLRHSQDQTLPPEHAFIPPVLTVRNSCRNIASVEKDAKE